MFHYYHDLKKRKQKKTHFVSLSLCSPLCKLLYTFPGHSSLCTTASTILNHIAHQSTHTTASTIFNYIAHQSIHTTSTILNHTAHQSILTTSIILTPHCTPVYAILWASFSHHIAHHYLQICKGNLVFEIRQIYSKYNYCCKK